MTEWAEILKASGPYTTPLCVFMLPVIGWLVKRMTAAEERERKLRDQRVEDLREATQMLTQSQAVVSEVKTEVANALEKFDRTLQGYVRGG